MMEMLVKNLMSNILIVDYRGYGNSKGEASEKGVALDARAILAYAQSRTDINKNLYVFGKALGGAVAIELCMNAGKTVKGVILENAFASMTDMIKVLMPMVSIARPLV